MLNIFLILIFIMRITKNEFEKIINKKTFFEFIIINSNIK